MGHQAHYLVLGLDLLRLLEAAVDPELRYFNAYSYGA